MELYYNPISSPSRAVLWFLARHGKELKANGCPVEKLNVINLQKGDHLTDEYEALNMYQTVPLLRVRRAGAGGGDKVVSLTECGAILSYLSAKAGGVEGGDATDAFAQAQIREAQLHHEGLARRVSDTQRDAINARRTKPELTQADQRKMIEAGEKFDELKYSLFLLNKLFAMQQFVAGDQMTVADYPVAAELSRLEPYKAILPDCGECLEKDYPHVMRYVRVISTLAGYDEFVAPLKNLLPFIATE